EVDPGGGHLPRKRLRLGRVARTLFAALRVVEAEGEFSRVPGACVFQHGGLPGEVILDISKNVPMLIGSVSEEGNRMSPKPTEAEWHATLAGTMGDAKASALIAAMKKAHREKSIRTLSYGVSGLLVRNNVARISRMKYELKGVPVYPVTFGAPNPAADGWALNDEAVADLGYMQLKKTHDAAMVLIQRMFGARPRFNYFFGNSQGGREALTVVQRYPADYDGVSAEVPIVSFSTLMLGPELIRIKEKPLDNWVPPAKVNAIRGEFMRQCDKLDGLVDGMI